jgi:hypothetical protein
LATHPYASGMTARPFQCPFTRTATAKNTASCRFILQREIASSSVSVISSINQGTPMILNNSPLEILAAFAIVFVTGALSAVGLVKYVEKVRRDAHSAN